MSQAIFGLVGVIVGAIVSSGMTMYLEWARERGAARGASRILQSDLGDAEAQIDEALATGLRWPTELKLKTGRWYQSQAVMSRRLRRQEWHAVASAFDYLNGINEFDQLYRGEAGAERIPLDDQGKAQLEMGRRLIRAGLAHLERLAKWRSWLQRTTKEQRRATGEVQELLIAHGIVTSESLIEAGERIDPQTGRFKKRRRKGR